MTRYTFWCDVVSNSGLLGWREPGGHQSAPCVSIAREITESQYEDLCGDTKTAPEDALLDIRLAMVHDDQADWEMDIMDDWGVYKSDYYAVVNTERYTWPCNDVAFEQYRVALTREDAWRLMDNTNPLYQDAYDRLTDGLLCQLQDRDSEVIVQILVRETREEPNHKPVDAQLATIEGGN